MDEYAEIGRRLRAMREARGLLQEEMAARLGLSAVGYGAYERGDRKLPLTDIPRLADALGIRRLTLLRLLGLAELDDTEPVPEWMLKLLGSSQQNTVPPFGGTLRRRRALAEPTPPRSERPTWSAASARYFARIPGRTPVLVAAAG